jgi:hypothetical protein
MSPAAPIRMATLADMFKRHKQRKHSAHDDDNVGRILTKKQARTHTHTHT